MGSTVLKTFWLKMTGIGRTRWQRSRWTWSTSLSTAPRIHEEYTFRYRNACGTPAESGKEYLTSGKEYIEPNKTQ